MPYDYRKSERLRKNSEFVATMKGKRLSLDGLSLFYRQNSAGAFRVGITVSRKLANAVGRNRLRRQVRECIRQVLRDRTAGYDLVFVARQGLVGRKFQDIRSAVTKVLERSSMIGRGPEGFTR